MRQDESSPLRVLVIAVEPPWPAVHGGRIRTARLSEEIASRGARVTVVFPGDPDCSYPVPPGISIHVLRLVGETKSRRLRALLSLKPKLGVMHVGPHTSTISGLSREADIVLYATDYLAAVSLKTAGFRSVIDLANVEVDRQLSLSRDVAWFRRITKYIESIKARAWEPRVWRRADIVLALTRPDQERVSRAGGVAIFAPNGVDRRPYRPSPIVGKVLMVASFDYQPNRMGAEWLVSRVWPLVRAAIPTARLVLAGRGARQLDGIALDESVEIISDFPSADALYEEAAVLVNPVSTGGGAQLKIGEALANHRVIVARTYSRSCVPESAVECGQVMLEDDPETFARLVASALSDVAKRHEVEMSLEGTGLPTWPDALREGLDALLGVRVHPR